MPGTGEVRVGCVVLAAGSSRRFGARDKLLAPLGGMPLLAWVLRSLPAEWFAACTTVICSDEVGALCEAEGYTVTRITAGTQSDSLKAGLLAMPETLDGWLFVNGDRPFLRSETVVRMLDAFSANPADPVRLTWKGTPSNPVLFPMTMREELLGISGDCGGKVLFRGRTVTEVEARSQEELMDADDPETLQIMNQLLKLQKNRETEEGTVCVHC